MIESIEFKNFKVLKDAKLPLGPFTLIVGSNGSGKSTALQGLQALMLHAKKDLQNHANFSFDKLVSLDSRSDADAKVQLKVTSGEPWQGTSIEVSWKKGESQATQIGEQNGVKGSLVNFKSSLQGIRVYFLNPRVLPASVVLQPTMELGEQGEALAGVLDRLRDQHPERFEALNGELGRLFPDFDRVLFDTPKEGHRAFLLRTRKGQHQIPASELSQGTLLAMAMLTLAYLPHPPTIIGLEEPDRGIHPRLLRQVRDALYRLSYPKSFGESRPPAQVIATTQSPYFLDEYSDHPEEIVVAEKKGLEATFSRLMDGPHMAEILEGTSSLGEVWYTGVLGGVPARS